MGKEVRPVTRGPSAADAAGATVLESGGEGKGRRSKCFYRKKKARTRLGGEGTTITAGEGPQVGSQASEEFAREGTKSHRLGNPAYGGGKRKGTRRSPRSRFGDSPSAEASGH